MEIRKRPVSPPPPRGSPYVPPLLFVFPRDRNPKDFLGTLVCASRSTPSMTIPIYVWWVIRGAGGGGGGGTPDPEGAPESGAAHRADGHIPWDGGGGRGGGRPQSQGVGRDQKNPESLFGACKAALAESEGWVACFPVGLYGRKLKIRPQKGRLIKTTQLTSQQACPILCEGANQKGGGGWVMRFKRQ